MRHQIKSEKPFLLNTVVFLKVIMDELIESKECTSELRLK